MDCVVCGGLLTGRQRLYCSAACSKQAGRAQHIEKTYGITLADWDEIWEYQGRVCAICERAPKVKADGTEETFHLDHEHATGQSGPIRGIVCPFCNTRVLGTIKGKRAANLARYLTCHPAMAALGRVVIAPGRPRKKRQPRKRTRRTA